MIDLRQPIKEIAAGIKDGRYTAVDVVQASLDRLRETESYHTVLATFSDSALAQARLVDDKIARGDQVGLLAGIPFIAKDNFLTSIGHTTAASGILEPFQSPYQAIAINRLEAAGAILVAKANLDAFAHGSSTENSDFGPTRNPLNPNFSPGGSSGGSAASVALGQACFALGTDTGGSIRQPASFCGVVGLKPTYGLVPRTGVVAMGSSVDVIGPICNSVQDSALILDIIAGPDPSDATMIARSDDSYAALKPSLKALKIGVIREYMGPGVSETVQAAIREVSEMARASGAIVEEVSLPATELALACYYVLIPAEVSSNLARYDGIKYGHSATEAKTLSDTYLLSRSEGFGDEAKRRIMIGTYVLSSGYYDAYYKRAQRVRTLLVREFNEAMSNFDLLIGPTTPTTAFKLGEKNHDPLAMYASDVMTVAVNLVGAPAISIPAGLIDGMPVGVQLIGGQGDEQSLLDAASGLEALLATKKSQVPA